MSAQHTPGPWTVQEREYSFRVVDCRALKFDNSRLCDVQHWSGATRGPDREESRANARLIAAAPELLNELRECRDLLMCVETCSRNNFETLAAERLDAINAIVAKATGDAA